MVLERWLPIAGGKKRERTQAVQGNLLTELRAMISNLK
jgi:hypothetical protein